MQTFLRHSLHKIEKSNEELRKEIEELYAHINHLQYIIKVQRTKLYELEHYGKNL